MKRLLVALALPLLFACERKVFNSGGDCVSGFPPSVGVKIFKAYIDPNDTSKTVVQYKYSKGWSWDQLEVRYDSGSFYLNTLPGILPGLKVKWKTDTTILFGYNYLSNDSTRWPGTLFGSVQLIDTAGHVMPITRKYYSLAVAFYRINRCPDPYSEIFIHQTLDTGIYKGYELNIVIEGPLNSFKQ